MEPFDINDRLEPIHVLDLPGLHTEPSSSILLDTLSLVVLGPASWDHGTSSPPPSAGRRLRQVNPEGLTRYLTSIIASDLSWLADEAAREQVWATASRRLSERAGRAAMPALSRTFHVPTSAGRSVGIMLHEPSLTADNTGLKTWASAYLLAKRLHTLPPPTPSASTSAARVLELGSGTGLLGLAAAAVWPAATVQLTDLPAIVPNLTANALTNASLAPNASAAVLDWRTGPPPSRPGERYDMILASDVLYEPAHPALLAAAIGARLRPGRGARAAVEVPCRAGYALELRVFRDAMARRIGMELVDEGEEEGWDDWGDGRRAEEGADEEEGDGGDGRRGRVRCWWGVWTRPS